jgi:hypothetical protein
MVERVGDTYEIPADPGNLRVQPGPMVPMPKPTQVDGGGEAIRAPGGQTGQSDNPPSEMGVDSPTSIGVPQVRPTWNGDSQGPNPPSSSNSHPAMPR